MRPIVRTKGSPSPTKVVKDPRGRLPASPENAGGQSISARPGPADSMQDSSHPSPVSWPLVGDVVRPGGGRAACSTPSQPTTAAAPNRLDPASRSNLAESSFLAQLGHEATSWSEFPLAVFERTVSPRSSDPSKLPWFVGRFNDPWSQQSFLAPPWMPLSRTGSM